MAWIIPLRWIGRCERSDPWAIAPFRTTGHGLARVEDFIAIYNTHHAKSFIWKDGITFYQ